MDRNERLKADYREMLKIQNRPYLKWIAVKGELPYAEEYLLTAYIRTYALTSDGERYIVGAIDRCTIKVALWDSYPHVAPYSKMVSLPPVFHPDWYSKGVYCSSQPWHEERSLKDYVLRMIGTLTYDPALMATAAPANYKALSWYRKNGENEALFPSDPIALTENTPDEAAALEKAAVFREEVDSWKIIR